MKKFRILSLFMVVFIILAIVASGCGKKAPDTSKPAETSETAKESEQGTESESSTESGESGEYSEPYTFTHYFNYDWWGIKPWGEDEVSKYLSKKFNVHVEFAKPDSDPAAKLNVMISSGDLPDSIMMDRGPDNIRLARLGLLQPLEPFMTKNPNLQENLLPQTIELLKIDGKLYGIPNWPRTAPTGGNDVWMYNLRIWQDAGSPKLETFEDLYAFAKKVKTDVTKTREGLSTIPFMTDATGDGWRLANAFYRSYGGVLNGWYTVLDGKYRLAFRDPVFKEVSLELNKWWREGLIAETQFTDTTDQILEKATNGRIALFYYDHSQDDNNHFRKILKKNHPDDSYELVQPNVFPPAKGLSPNDIYGDITSTVGWNVTCITTKAKNPQRIFDLWTYLLTREAAIIQMYGPPGFLWDTLDDQGLPILKKAEGELTAEERDRLGLWFWMIPGHSDHVDTIKFAVNDKLPEEKRNWVVSMQAHIVTPTKLLSDEFVGIGDVIDPQSDLGIQRTLCEDYIKANYPKVIMAKSPEEAEKVYEDIIKFCDQNGMPQIEETYDKKYQDNVKRFGTVLKKGRYAK
ncbi:ABC-type glycerol-3-phosphate transport system substrate-binding protein [Caldicoprobacter guelmensis]|uniref:extracellular solute-binding protein n=1 Tax=Caldicoprobacter guelmensis TaxID=1170224 RepID=UPI00195E4E9F|nr:extracellular solute-binding protein [Caldicoprobacter guelmensis]MBM7582198.1 ABC-type glycerol-3-phosphate transport system substrate-binding protein [Caldicoprobacter guelmensis]